jgi:hypothetical protein
MQVANLATTRQEFTMPIEVPCPNPVCAKVHLVKNKYAGLRGQCPACRSWMFVPNIAPPTVAGCSDSHRPKESPIRHQPSPSAVSQRETPAVKPKAKKRFSWAVAVLLLFGILSLGTISATPYLDGSSIQTSDCQEEQAQQPEKFKDQGDVYVMAVPACVAGLALLNLLGGLICRQFGFANLFFVYLVTLLAAGLLFLAAFAFHNESSTREKFSDSVEASTVNENPGEAEVVLGQYLYAGLGSAAAACLFFVLAALAMHRHWWSRVFAFVFLAFFVAIGPVWIYQQQLHIDVLKDYLPF